MLSNLDPTFSATQSLPSNKDSHTETAAEMEERLKVMSLETDFRDHLVDIIGSDNIKEAIEQAVIMPHTMPHLYKKRKYPNAMLLIGASGLGKKAYCVGTSVSLCCKSKCLLFAFQASPLWQEQQAWQPLGHVTFSSLHRLWSVPHGWVKLQGKFVLSSPWLARTNRALFSWVS